MTQQNVNTDADVRYRKKLFYDNGIRYKEVKARLVNDYKPPTPVLKSQVNTTLQASAGLYSAGTSHYTVELTLLFYHKQDFSEWIQFIGAEHKYYDEKGSIYIGIADGEPSVRSVEMETKYLVTVNFSMIRKQEFELRHESPFIDIKGHWAQTYIEEMQQRGLVSVYNYNGTEIQYFRPDDELNRAEACAFMIRTFRYIDRILRGS